MTTYKELVNNGTEVLEQAGIYPGFARVLMLEMLREQDLDMFSVFNDEASEELIPRYESNIQKLLQDIPLGYVLGYEWFYGYKLDVNPDVLIPRGETEELVGYVLSDIDAYFEDPVIADVACGSGAIGIALSLETGLPVVASDISDAALEVAKSNAKKTGANVTFFQGDMLDPLIEKGIKLDVLVCNPPYIKNTEHIQTSVLNNEPHVALFGGDDGLYFYRRVLEKAHLVLNRKAMIAFEIGFDIGEAVVSLAQHHFPTATIELRQDINKLDRMVFVYQDINRL